MSAIRQPTSTARTLGDAVPVILTRFGEKRAPASEGKKIGDIQAEHQEWLDGQQTTAGCVECPDWSFTGPASEARTVAAEHRAELHPELVGRRTFRKKGRIAPGREKSVPGEREALNAARAEREDADRLEKIERGRRARGELEEAASRLGPGAASSSPTPHDQEEPMENPYGLQRFGRGYKWPADVALRSVTDFAAVNGRPPQKQDARDLPIGALPSEETAETLFGDWNAMVRAAGLEPAARAQRQSSSRTTSSAPQPTPTPTPEPEPEPELPPAAEHAAEHAALVPVDAAPPGRTSSRLVQILSRLTTSDLEESADWYTAAIQQLEHERSLITQAIEAKAA